MIGSSEKHLVHIYNALKQRLLSQNVIHGDETTVQVLKEKVRASQKLDRISANSRTAVSLKSGQFDEVGPRQPGFCQG